MSLTDVMSGSGLSLLPSIALVIFAVVFVGVLIHLFLPTQRSVHARAAELPLADDAPLANTNRNPAALTSDSNSKEQP